MNDLRKFKAVLIRLVAVILTAGICLILGTASFSNTDKTVDKSLSPSPDIHLSSPPPTPAPVPQPEYFELSFVGDCTLASTIYNKSLSISYENTVGTDYSFPFAKTVQYFSEDDFTFANLECALTTSTTSAVKTFCFRADPSYAEILTSGSVEFVSLANNHVMDYLEQGYEDTKLALETANISYSGRDDWNIYKTESGLKIGVYSLSFGNTDQVKAGVTAVRNAGAEFVIAALHWGDEGSYNQNSTQVTLAHAAIDAGADFVYGSHPHTIQPLEEYKGKYIYYSFGNWSFGGNTAPRDPDTFILKMTLMKDVDGTISISERKHIPCSCTGVKGGNNYQPCPYEEDSEDYLRTLSKLDGTYNGPNLTINYSYSNNE